LNGNWLSAGQRHSQIPPSAPTTTTVSRKRDVSIDILLVGGFDEEASPLHAKVSATSPPYRWQRAIANAVYRATAKRLRDLRIS
jgi:hypothetical protein